MPNLNLQDASYGIPEDINTESSTLNDIRAVKRLPEDILVQIFTVAKACPLDSRPPCTLFLRRVSQVCGHWRRICINNPLLWACIHIQRFPLSRFTGECISRTKDVPISLNIGPPNNEQTLTIDVWTHLLGSLSARNANTERWRALILRVGDYQVLPSLLEYLGPRSAPNLELISCSRIGGYLEPHPNRQLGTASSSSSTLSNSPSPLLPNLRSLKLMKINLGHLFGRSSAMLTSLTHLNLKATGLDSYTPDALALLLSSNPHLEELSIREDIESENYTGSFNSGHRILPITFSSLRRLKLQVVDPYSIVGSGLEWVVLFLRAIDVPNLQQLIVISPARSYISLRYCAAVEHLVDFLSAGYMHNQMAVSEQALPRKSLYPGLRYFGVFFPLLTGRQPRNPESLLRALPSLTHLGILGEDIAVVNRAPQCSSGLVYLSVQNLTQYDFDLKSALCRRHEAGFPIRVVALQHNGGTGPNGFPCAVEFYDRSQALEFLDLDL